ncbi:unnamed protein product [Trifolium pratense]|uniref:Uncharacterized protein n=1 Tax=Trifolium pratense TaxID=57577 RepID=A0ACB0IJD0_TRIPR|nr:unnamed protein product [Trifolium pratense]
MQSQPGHDCSLDRCHDSNHQANDRNRLGRSRSHYNRGLNTIHRSGKRKHTRSSSTHHRSRSVSKGARRRLAMVDRCGLSKDMEENGRSFAGSGRSNNGREEENGSGVAINHGLLQGPAMQVKNRVGALKEEARPVTVIGMDKDEMAGGGSVVKEASHQRKGDVMNDENYNGVGGASGSALKRSVTVLVDGIQVEIKIVEEWGYALGEDSCLFEEESEAESSCGEGQEDQEVNHNVDLLVNQFKEGLEAEDHNEPQGMQDEEFLNKLEDNPGSAGVGTNSVLRMDSQEVVGEPVVRADVSPLSGDAVARSICRPLLSKRTSSCPPEARRSAISGPWSLEWLQDQNHGDAGVIFSASKKSRKQIINGPSIKRKVELDPRRRKAGGLLRHPFHSLKKVARMPSKDRCEVLKALKKKVRRRRGGDGFNRSCSMSRHVSSGDSVSSGSINNDWTNWVAIHGNDQVAVDDVWGIGKAIGVNSTLWGNSSHGFSYRSSVGASGGLLTLWDSSEVEVWSTESREHVLWCHGRFSKTGEEFYVANVYAPCEDGAKQGLWDLLSVRLHLLAGKKVCVWGDFNAVKHIDERRSVRDGHRSSDHIPFNRFIEDNTLIDLPLIGRKFTWFKGDGRSMSRLDRFLLSEEWCLNWPNCKQMAKLRGLSDHCPLVLSADEEDWGPRPSRMLKCWKDIPGYNLFVRDKWNSLQVDGWGGYVLKEKLKMIKVALKEWHKTHAQNLPSRIDNLKIRLASLDEKGEEDDISEEDLVELHGVSHDIHSLSRLQASISWQQSRSLWLKEGDANSKYFHSVLASRRRRNALSVIQVDGVTLEGVNPIRQAVFSHFESHFQAPNVDRPGVDDLQFKRLNPMEIGGLTKPFSENEVKLAVWDCDSYKSPGPDGINFGFIKDFWAELRGDVMRFLSDFHRNGRLTKGINSTFIALIPKTDSPQRLNDFRPISLTAFVKNRQILDGILIANEVVDEARKSKKDLLLFKVDFEKAYDSVDWGYLDAVMGRMSFPTLWRKWIRECVCMATASVLVNGSPTDEFPLRRGLRQGDPLSPFLFLLAAEGLNVLMEAMVARNLFQGYSVGGQGSVSVSHLQFADDTLLMGVKSWANVRALRAVLVLFETMSGLKVNFNKSMLVGVNIPESWLCEAASILCCKVGKIPFLYLGLQIGGDPRRLVFWEPMLNRLKTRLSGWKSRFLSFGGRLVLLKSVLTSLPVYALSFFKAPSSIISSIESLFIKFFWGGCEDSRKISWVSWKSVCLRKEYGGLGVRQLREFNIALLGKWCWRMLVDREGLWFRVLAARYGIEGGILRAGGQRGSVWWRELVRIREGVGEPGGSWFREHVSRRVGDGSDTLFWTDPWLDGISLRERFGRLFELAVTKSRSVADMFALGWGADGGAWEWRRSLWVWEEEMLGECQSLLLDISLQNQAIDRWQWSLDPDTGYTVGGVYQHLTSQDSVTLDDADNLIWHSQVPLKVSIFA